MLTFFFLRGTDAFATQLFSQQRIQLLGTSEFKRHWACILKESGAKVVERLFSDTEDRIDLILFEDQNEVPRNFLAKIENLGLKKATIEWAIQCLINQEILEIFENDLDI